MTRNRWFRYLTHTIGVLLLVHLGSAYSATLSTMVVPWSVHNQIQPDTVYCVMGTNNNPVPYCSDATPCKTFPSPLGGTHTVCLANAVGAPAGASFIPNTCWDTRTEFTCLQYTEDCSKYLGKPKCKEVGVPTCISPAPSNMAPGALAKVNGCLSTSRHFECQDSAAVTNPPVQLGCQTSTTVDGLNWSSKTESASNDFIAVTTSAEIARQLATYGDKNGAEINNLFKGVALGCRNKGFGLKDCCSENSSGARSNAVVAAGMGAVGKGFQYGAGYAMQFGSQYMYDTVGPQVVGTFLEDGVFNMIQGIEASGYSMASMASSFGFMGFGTTAAGAASGTGASLGLYGANSSIALGNSGIFFNPYALAFAVGVQLVMATLECNELERELASARNEQLCHYVGDYCSSPVRVLGVQVGCTETTSNFCCYNGLLGKAIAEGGRLQLGMSWGSGEFPSCGGFTMDQLSRIDFNSPSMQAALKPFQDQIMRNYQSKTQPGLQDGSVTTQIQTTGTEAARKLCLQRKLVDPNIVCPG